MSFFIQTHIVKKGETLESIAEMYHLPNAEFLRNYHNQNCPLEELIERKTLYAGQEVYIPDERKVKETLDKNALAEEERERNSKSRFLNSSIPFLPERVDNHYQVEIRLTNYVADTLEKQTTIHYDVKIKWIGTQQYPILEMRKFNFLVEGETPETKLGELICRMMEGLYPIEIGVSKNGEMATLQNLQQYQSKWLKTKNEIFKFYTDSYATKYIETVEENLHRIGRILEADLFLQCYFGDFRNNFKNGKSSYRKRFLKECMLFQINQELDVEDYGNAIIKVSLIGNKILEDTEDERECEISGYYQLFHNTGIVESLSISFENRDVTEKRLTEIKIKPKQS